MLGSIEFKQVIRKSSIERYKEEGTQEQELPFRDRESITNNLFFHFQRFHQDPINSITNVYNILAKLDNSQIPFFAIFNSQFPQNLFDFIINNIQQLLSNESLYPTLHVCALITLFKRSYTDIIPFDLISALLTVISTNSEAVVFGWWILYNISCDDGMFEAFFNSGLFNYINEIIPKFQQEKNEKILFLISNLIKRVTSCFANDSLIPLYSSMVNQLLDCQLVLPVKSALKSLSRLILSDCNDGIEIQTDLLNHASFFLSTDSDILIGRSLSVFLDVFRISNEDLINSLIHTKIFEFIRNPLIHENSTLQASASYLLVKLVASNKQFEEIALSSDLIDIICKNALDSEFKSREQAVSTICEFIQCRHSVSMIEHIKNCGGLLAISVALGGATDENAKDIINAVHHVVTQMPCEMDTFLEYGLLNELEDILSTPDELLSDDVFNAADTLREEIISYLNAENVE